MRRPRLADEADHYRVPDAPPTEVDVGGFQLWSTGLMPELSQAQCHGLAELYRQAFEQACIAARPTHPESVLFTVWN